MENSVAFYLLTCFEEYQRDTTRSIEYHVDVSIIRNWICKSSAYFNYVWNQFIQIV